MSDHKFDQFISEIRNEQVNDGIVSEAGERVWSSISGSPVAELGRNTLRSCEDFKALIPAYLGQSLGEPRRLRCV